MTKKLLSLLLAVLMVMSYVTPVMALPLDLKPLEDAVEDTQAAIGGIDKLDPIGGGDAVLPGAETQAKPAKLSTSVVQRMKIKAYAASGTKTADCQPSQGAKLLSYTIGEVTGSDEEGWTTTVTFHFKSGDKFEAAARDSFNTRSEMASAGITGNWVYYFNDTHPADQTLTLYRNGNAWAYYDYRGVLTNIKSSGNISIGHLIAVDMRLDTELPTFYTVTYTDGADDEEVFADQTYTVEEGKATPAFKGEPTREGYIFKGWQPEIAEAVTADATYTAQWEVESKTVARVESTGEEYETLQAAIDAAKALIADENGNHSAQTVTLLKNVTESVSAGWVRTKNVAWNFDLTIDLNGYTLTGSGGSVITVLDGSNFAAKMTYTLHIKDSVGTGVITGGNAATGGAIYLKGKPTSTVVIDGGTFTGNTATSSGGAIWANISSGGKIIVNNGTFTKNTAPTGGAITALNLTVNGGVFTENSATGTAQNTGRGGAICVWGTPAYLTVNGGKIYNNTAALNGDDIVFQIQANRVGEMKLISAKDMGVFARGWYRDEVGARYSEDNEVEFTEYASYKTKGAAVSLKAVLGDPEYTVTYTDGVDGEEVFADQSYTVKEGEATPAFNGTPSRKGYKFLGWQPAVAATVTEDVTYTAQWEIAKYKLTFNGNGTNQLSGTISGSYTSKTLYTMGTAVNLKTAMDGKSFTKALSEDYSTNYRQIGWNTKADGSGEHYEMNGTLVMPDSDVTLYAEWEGYEWIYWNVQMGVGGDYITYTTKYMGPKADVQSFKAYTGNEGNQYGKVPEAYYTPVKATAKEEYKFIGWYDVAKNNCISTKDTLYVQDFRDLRALKLGESGSVLEARFEHIACDKHLEDVRVITEPTCTEDGLKLCRCTVCGKEIEVVLSAPGHDHSGKWTWNREDHWKKCPRCGEILDRHEHIYGEWKAIGDNREERGCTVCGFIQYAQIIKIDGKPTTKPTDEENPNTGAEVR